MSKRPYLSKSVVEMEAIYEASRADKPVVDLLMKELAFRTTQKAAALKQRISVETATPSPVNAHEWATAVADQPATAAPTHTQPTQPQHRRPPPAFKPMEMPPITNQGGDILSSWMALEVLSPSTFKKELDLVPGDKDALAMFTASDLPWEISQVSRKNKRLYFEVFFGTITMAPAIAALLNVYSDSRPEKPNVKGFSPIASVILDKEGRPLEEHETASISSFAWGVPVALGGDLRKLADWPDHEKDLIKGLRNRLIRRNRDNEIVPLTRRHIDDVYNWLVLTLKLDGLETRGPYFALKRFEWMYSKNPPEPGLLNSFYLEDLKSARSLVDGGRVPNALRHYLGISSPASRTDLLEDTTGLPTLLQPKMSPAGRWPSEGRHPLAILQQAAVNAVGGGAEIPTGILGVNGPPGTGKTTLLRDVFAARVVERAGVMATFDKPAQAFEPSRVNFSRSGATLTLHRLDNRLKGFEMVVASSNNKAVENVSAELPSMGAIAKDAPSLRYFKTISDNVLKAPSWGMVAAVLGNSGNRFQFSTDFWKDEELGLSTYLNHASGHPQIVVEPQESGPPVRRLREIVQRESPPENAKEAASRWDVARTRFRRAKSAFEDRQNRIQTLHVQLTRLEQIGVELPQAVEQRNTLEPRAIQCEAQLGISAREMRDNEQALANAQDKVRSHGTGKPGLLSRLFNAAHHREWTARSADLAATVKRYEQALQQLKRQHGEISAEIVRVRDTLGRTVAKIAELNDERTSLETSTRQARAVLGAEVPDQEFFARPHGEIHVLNVWFDTNSNLLRDQVFEAALQLHRAFIDCAADRLRQNLAIFMESFGTRTLGTAEKDAMIPEMWASFFLVVPLISTTFASVHRMFSRLKPETLGWLLVDEAGQAAPQAVVGAMMRTKRSIVVGDPMQVEPVVTLPSTLTQKICRFFGVDPLRFNAPEASVQTLADAASIYCARFPIGSGHRTVGAPLLVHRRCNSPMYDISNEIAYANLMVQAKRPTPDNDVLGRSAWLNVVSQTSTDKWAPDEGAAVVQMLRRLRDVGHPPDLYVVTPFVIVQDNLRSEITRSGVLDGWVEKPWKWAKDRVGTVHTVQGREAAIVFFVLGASMLSQDRARAWAGGSPNLVNVAVTRAKTTLYVIGNRALWKTAGHFSTIDRFLPSMSPPR
ncbi:AAA domain-containing protein [Rhizobium sp. L245/93]|uniref:DEAD/DEAH box helicase n=1 Tax=Rhizobium sp. L245/93 TaxID=2819998 RepID=UPI001ADCCADB|nr:AAA domain-containing protein [Rhizobium sp. L245/93]MBO9170788.1 hypothetical protein [Rhizobium sp. L245/93]